jgi:diguanylate cyclase (GGDEF)-like protein
MEDKLKSLNVLLGIRTRILLFAMLAILLPALGMGWLLNNTIHVTITEKAEQKLIDTSKIIHRELSLWFKERNYDLRVISNSFVITENFAKYQVNKDLRKTSNNKPDHIKKVSTYLSSIEKQFPSFKHLFLLDNSLKQFASSKASDKDIAVNLPGDTEAQIQEFGFFKGEPNFNDKTQEPSLIIGVPIYTEALKESTGLLGVVIDLDELQSLMQELLINVKSETPIYGALFNLEDMQRILTTDNAGNNLVKDPEILERLLATPGKIEDFINSSGKRLVGVGEPLDELGWGLLIADDYNLVYRSLIDARYKALFVVLSFTLAIGLVAYHFSIRILKPLSALTTGATKVAAGDLSVQLPIYLNDELGLTTRVFNKMVAELQQSHNQLEEMATTDTLTGLANRKQIMNLLIENFAHYQRYETVFTIMMLDVDHFKNVNDTYGHLAGDAVLTNTAQTIKNTLREIDRLGRFGGEEFLVILPETDGQQATKSAERIRKAVKDSMTDYENNSLKVTVSIGVAVIQSTDNNENDLINRADDALYSAKGKGRDRVVLV